jgi:hypothetical protein
VASGDGRSNQNGCAVAFGVLIALFCMVEYVIPIALVGGVVIAVILYLRSTFRTLVREPEPPSQAPDSGPQPAYVQYFMGPALDDLRAVVSNTRDDCAAFGKACGKRIRRGFLQSWPEGDMALRGVLVLALWAGVAAGAAVATLALVVHTLTVLASVAVARALIWTLRVVDTGLLRVEGITITCGTCHHRVPYAVYACPGPGCRRRHGDVRPGRYGAFRRVCTCGTRMPTLVLLGSFRMRGFCPYCDHPLADRTGSAAEIILPFLGPTASGKTRLMLTLVTALDELSTASGGGVEFASAETVQRLNELLPALARGLSTPPTNKELPRAYSLNATTGRGAQRFVHLFDMAGERLNRQDDAHELRFLGLARTFVFVLDPLSLDGFWQEVPVADRRRLSTFRSRQPPQNLLTETSERIEALGRRRRRSRVAVAVSKNDLVAHLPTLADVSTGSASIEAWLVDCLHLGNLVRVLRHEFGDVRFFFTAAVVDAGGRVDPSVLALARWLFQGEGLSFGGEAS